MIKGINNNILCDSCRTIITNQDFITIKGKKNVLHFCNNDKCCNLDIQIENLGYKKLSNITWKEHGMKCNSHPISTCAKKMPNCNEFFDSIVFQKKIRIYNGSDCIIEIARPKKIKKTKKIAYCDYRIGIVYASEAKPKIILRLFFELVDTNKNAINFVKDCEKEVFAYINFIFREKSKTNIL